MASLGLEIALGFTENLFIYTANDSTILMRSHFVVIYAAFRNGTSCRQSRTFVQVQKIVINNESKNVFFRKEQKVLR